MGKVSMGKKNMRWVAFFSQTGGEIINLSRELKNSPDVIITNNPKIETLDIPLVVV